MWEKMDDDSFSDKRTRVDASGINKNVWRNKARLVAGADNVLKCESANCLD